MSDARRSRWVTATVLGAPAPAWAQGPGWDGWAMHPMWGLWGVGMAVMMVASWALLIAGLVLGIRWLVSQGRERRPGHDRALEILRERYARGEIGREEFEARRRDLEGA